VLQLLVLVAFVTPNALHYSSAQQAFSTQGERSKTDAFACIAEALALDSLSAATRYQLGRLYEIYGDTALAIEQYNRALHLDTSYVSCSLIITPHARARCHVANTSAVRWWCCSLQSRAYVAANGVHQPDASERYAKRRASSDVDRTPQSCQPQRLVSVGHDFARAQSGRASGRVPCYRSGIGGYVAHPAVLHPPDRDLDSRAPLGNPPTTTPRCIAIFPLSSRAVIRSFSHNLELSTISSTISSLSLSPCAHASSCLLVFLSSSCALISVFVLARLDKRATSDSPECNHHQP